ncbi:MAG: hypothetical protein JSV46_08640 [Candidatus Aminicenantes bacterium]|nr:MAG: hypothetical protein JSV46_08640 [Candidatus Aminicenantes bacterium]
MLKKRKSSLKKNMAILVCVAFICLMFPDVSHAASRSSSLEFPFIKQYIFLFSSLFSAANHDIQFGIMAFTTHTILANKKPEPVTPPSPPPKEDEDDKKSKDDPVETEGNSKPKKKPNGKE